jgi:MORN repeat
VDGERHGYGVFYYANGSKYEGEWEHNLKCGFAVFTEDNGNLTQGYFKADKLIRNIKDEPM